jgi:hypothetical protein
VVSPAVSSPAPTATPVDEEDAGVPLDTGVLVQACTAHVRALVHYPLAKKQQ